MLLFTGVVAEVRLPTDPDLGGSSSDPPVLPSLLSFDKVGTGIPTTKNPIAIVAEGLPPIPTKLLEKIQRWEYIDLALLLRDTKSYELAGYQPSNQVLVFQSIEQLQRKKKSITDLQSWVQTFSVYAVTLGGARSISYEQSVGLWAHQHLIVQLYKDLGATQAIKYDQDFREWVAAKGIKKWGDLNLPIYGRCLSIQQKSAYPTPAVLAPSSARLRREKRENQLYTQILTPRGAHASNGILSNHAQGWSADLLMTATTVVETTWQ